MRVLLQRVDQAAVVVGETTVAQIDRGLLAFIGIARDDTAAIVDRLADRVLRYRMFADENGRMNRSLLDTRLKLLAVSQFTLCADTNSGLRPSFTPAAEPELARDLYQQFVSHCRAQGVTVEEGEFGADMRVQLVNNGPVTFLLES